MQLKVVIATHINSNVQLTIALESLLYRDHLDDIVVVVSGITDPIVKELYKKYYNLKHVVTHESNFYEYTSFIAMANQSEFTPPSFYIMLHDSIQASPFFWEDLQAFTPDKAYVWYPLCDNFNMGIICSTFLKDRMYSAYTAINLSTLTKNDAIAIELTGNHPLSFKSLAGHNGWRYAFHDNLPPRSFRKWRNDTDVYGDGIARCVTCIFSPNRPFLLKFVRMDCGRDNTCEYAWDFTKIEHIPK
jgi:hypothetical protein